MQDCSLTTSRYAHEVEQLREELERYKELLVTYEQSIARKDHIIANLTRALQKQVYILYDDVSTRLSWSLPSSLPPPPNLSLCLI